MPRGQRLKIQWIEKNGARQATFRKRRDTLIQKARELSILCSVPAAVVVYGAGEAQPTFWPAEVEEVKGILQRYRDLPDSSKEAHRLDNQGFMRRRSEKMKKKVENYKSTSRDLEVNLVINDVALRRRSEFDDLPRELTNAVVSALDALRSVTADRVNFLRSGGAAALPPPPLDEAAALLSLQDPLMVQPISMVAPVVVANAPPLGLPAPPQSGLVVVPPPPQQEEAPVVTPLATVQMVADALLLLPAPELEPEPELMVALAPPLEEPLLLQAVEPAPLLPELVVEPQELPPAATVIPPQVADALLQLLAPEAEPELAPPPPPEEPEIVEVLEDAPPEVPVPEPQATAAAGVGVEEEEPVDLDFEPRNGSFLLEVADAIIDDGSGRLATDEDVDRLLREHGLEHMKPPK